MQDILFFIYISFIIFSIIFLGTTVMLGMKSDRSAKLFVILSFITACWVMANALVANYKNSSLVSLVEVATYIDLLLAAPLVGVYWYFVNSLEGNKTNSKTVNLLSKFIIPTLLIFASLIILSGEAIYFTEDPTLVINYSSYFGIYSAIIASVFLLTLIRLLNLFFSSKGSERSQYGYLTIGIATAGLMLFASNVLYPTITGVDSRLITNLSYFGLLVFIFMTSRAIIVHKLFNVRLVVAKSVAYISSLLIISVIFISVSLLLVGTLFEQEIPLNVLVVLAIIALITSLVFQPVKHKFDKLTNKVFYRDAYQPQDVINKVNSTLVNTTNLQKLLSAVGTIIENELNLEYAEFYLDPKTSLDYKLKGSRSQLISKSEHSSVLKYITSLDRKIFKSTDDNIDLSMATSIRTLKLECAIKMKSNDDEVGVLIIGERKSGSGFTQNDLQLLEIIADEVAIAVQNALRLEEITQFANTMQQKVDEATGELQKTNEKLRSLDEAKDEFISMASHQLRTPLTSVKGYISMVIEGDAGNISDTQKQYLNQAFVSSQRMVYLIADLLNVSRLKTGKFIIEPTTVYLPDVVESELEQLYETAAARGLELIFNKPKAFITLDLDETKIRQVIMNFVDNAIYYTPRDGRITVELKQLKNSIEYTVTDTGIGVPKKEQHHLFNKFYRAGNAKKARPDGTGLGLYMAKKVVVAQGGAIIFKTAEDKGSTFGFSFPIPKEDKQ